MILLEDSAAVEMAKNALMIGYAAGDSRTSVTQNVSLPTAGANGVSISWESSDIGKISTTGTVSRPDDANTAVTLTATLTKNEARDTRRFTLTVIISEDGMDVEMAKDALMIGYAAGNSRTNVTQDVTLPTEGVNGVSVSWASSDAARISTTGTVTRPSAANTEVTLTATLTKNDARDTRRFTLTVTLPCGTTSELVTKLQAMPPSLSGCSAASIRGANMTNLVSAGVTKEQLLAVWSADQDTGFTSAQLKAAGVTVAEMQAASLTISQIYTGGVSIADLLSAGLTIAQLDTGGVPDHALFNEACNTPRTARSGSGPTITLKTTTLTAMDTMVVLVGMGQGSIQWRSTELMGAMGFISFISETEPVTVGDATASFVDDEGGITSNLSFSLANALSNPLVSATDGLIRTTNIQICPGPGS